MASRTFGSGLNFVEVNNVLGRFGLVVQADETLFYMKKGTQGVSSRERVNELIAQRRGTSNRGSEWSRARGCVNQ